MAKRRLGAGTYAVLGALPQAAGYVAVPLALARSQPRRGWRSGRPGPLNLLGLVPLAFGAGMIGWAVASHYEQAPEDRAVTLVPDYLVATGAYGRSRNPLYVGGAGLWAGWATLLGSRRVALAGLAWLAGIVSTGVPFEERMLRKKFGDSYDDYVRRVPRWL